MTEQEKPPPWLKRPGRPWTPRHNLSQQKKSKNNTALILSAVAIAIALAAGVGLYGWGKQQAVNQTATSDAPLTNLRHCKSP